MFQLSKKKIFFGLFIWVFLLAITYLVAKTISFNNNSIKKPNKKKVIPDNLGVEYYSFYNENDLKFEEVYFDKKKESSYLKISGLINEEIEKQINQKIYDLSKAIYDKKENIYNEVTANFGNILSVKINYYHIVNDEYLYNYELLNFNLNDGNQISFDDLFTNDANINSLIYSGFYNRYSFNYGEQLLYLDNVLNAYEENPKGCGQYYCSSDYTKNDIKKMYEQRNQYKEKLNNVEEIAFKSARKYLSSSDKKFIIHNYGVELFFEDDFFLIDAKDFSNYFAFYKRFLKDKSIFKDNNIGKKNLFLSSIRNNSLFYSYIEQIGDYALIDYEEYDILSSKEQEFIMKIINNLKNNYDKNKFTYINISRDVSMDSAVYYIDTFTMKKEYYDSTIKQEIFSNKNTDYSFYSNHFYIDENDKNVSIDTKSYSYIYDKNGNVYTDLSELFIDGFDYKSYFRNEYFESNASNDVDLNTELKYEIDSPGIKIYFDNCTEENEYYIYVNEIPKEYLKIELSDY